MRTETEIDTRGLIHRGDKKPKVRGTMSKLGIQEIRSHQELQAQLRWDIHVRHIDLVLVLFIVAKVFADLFDNDATVEKQLRQQCPPNENAGYNRETYEKSFNTNLPSRPSGKLAVGS